MSDLNPDDRKNMAGFDTLHRHEDDLLFSIDRSEGVVDVQENDGAAYTDYLSRCENETQWWWVEPTPADFEPGPDHGPDTEPTFGDTTAPGGFTEDVYTEDANDPRSGRIETRTSLYYPATVTGLSRIRSRGAFQSIVTS